MQDNDKHVPVREYRAGKMKVAIWRREGQGNGVAPVQYSVKIQKSYRDKATKEWRTTEYLYPSDVTDLILILNKALEFTRIRRDANESAE